MGEYKTARTVCEQLDRMFSPSRNGLGMARVGILAAVVPAASEHWRSAQQEAAVAMDTLKALRNVEEVFVCALRARRSEVGLETQS